MKNTRQLALCFIVFGTILVLLGGALAITHIVTNSRSAAVRQANRAHAMAIRDNDALVARNTLAYENYKSAINSMITWVNGLSGTALEAAFPTTANEEAAAALRATQVPQAQLYVTQLSIYRRYGSIPNDGTTQSQPRPGFISNANATAHPTLTPANIVRPTFSTQNRNEERRLRLAADNDRQAAIQSHGGGRNFVSAFTSAGTMTGLSGTATILFGGIALLTIGIIKLPKKEQEQPAKK